MCAAHRDWANHTPHRVESRVPGHPSRAHVAIVTARIGRLLLRGEKTIESRFSRTRRPPLGCVSAGDLVHFKVCAGPVVCSRRVTALCEYEHLTQTTLLALKWRFGRKIGADSGYWEARRGCRFGVLMWLAPAREVIPPARLPRQYGNGWLVLD